MDDIIEQVDIADDHERPKLISALKPILLQCFTVPLWLIIAIPCLPLFLLGLFIWGMPPIIPAWSAFCKCFIAVFTEGKREEKIPLTNRVLILLRFFDSVIKTPANGTCWYIDELVHPSYHKVNIDKPVFMITAPRTGSSQLSKYLQDDTENFIAPTVAEVMFPYIWMWKLFVPIIVKLGLKERLSNVSMFGQESKKRQHSVVSDTETFDSLLRVWHFGVLSFYLGSSFMCWGLSFSRLNEPECNHEEFFQTFELFTECMMKKVMYYRGKPKQRMLVKGHFLVNANTFEQQYPKSKIFAVVRNPVDRFCSSINMIRSGAEDGPGRTKYGLFPTTWRVVRDYVMRTQIPYCEQEMLFYKQPADNKLVIPFTLYVNNLSATLQRIYSFCDIPIPDDVMSNAIELQTTKHDYTKHRASYNPKFNKSLTSLGVNERKLREHLCEYTEWINSLEDDKKTN